MDTSTMTLTPPPGTMYDVSNFIPQHLRMTQITQTQTQPIQTQTHHMTTNPYMTTQPQLQLQPQVQTQTHHMTTNNAGDGGIELPRQQVMPVYQGQPSIVNVTAVVTEVRKGSFDILAPKSGKTFTVMTNLFCPVRKGDAINATCQVLSPGYLNLLQSPIVAMPNNESAMMSTLNTVFYSDQKAVSHLLPKLYYHLKKLVDMRVYTIKNTDDIDPRYKYEYDEKTFNYKPEPENAGPNFVSDVPQLVNILTSRWFDYKDETIMNEVSSVLGVHPEFGDKYYGNKLANWWKANRLMRALYLLGFNNKEINEITTKSGLSLNQLYERLIFNPYTVPQVSIQKCIDIDIRTGREIKITDASCGAIVRSIWDNYSVRGWMCTSIEWLRKRHPFFDACMKCLKKEYGVVYDKIIVRDHSRNHVLKDETDEDKKVTYAYLNRAYMAEACVAKFISARMCKPEDISKWKDPYPRCPVKIKPGPMYPLPEPVISEGRFDDDQVEAIKTTMKGGVNIITGGAGVGKTTVTKEIVKNYELSKMEYFIGCPTGMSSSRVKQVIPGAKPMTIHRAIASPTRVPKFKKLIIDETSMVTDELLYDFFGVFGTDFDATFIGDAGQLPPIGAGSLFNEMLQSRTVTKTVLNTCHRTRLSNGEIDGILANCRRIANWPDNEMYTPEYSNNFTMCNGDDSYVRSLIKSFKDNGVSAKDFCIISPYNESLPQINKFTQLIYNGTNKKIVDPKRNCEWYVGDRVKMNVNSYNLAKYRRVEEDKGHNANAEETEMDVMNGEQGIIVDVNQECVVVDFDDSRVIEIPFIPKPRYSGGRTSTAKDIDDEDDNDTLCTARIDLSFAITVHGSQGNEFQFVVCIMPQGRKAGTFLNRNLVYTMLSRARRFCYCIGDITTLCEAVGKPLPYKCERLSDRLVDLLPRLYEVSAKQQLDIFEMDYGEGCNLDMFDYMDDDM